MPGRRLSALERAYVDLHGDVAPTPARPAKRQPTALEREWEAKLAAEGLGDPDAPDRSIYANRGARTVRIVPLESRFVDHVEAETGPTDCTEWAMAESIRVHGATMKPADTSRGAYWRQFSADVWRYAESRPRPKGRWIDMLHAVAETGSQREAGRRVGADRTVVREAVVRFNAWRKVNR